jgi:hypothetical protein
MCLFHFFANSMERSPCEAESNSASHEISHLLWNPKIYFRVHKSPQPVPSPPLFSVLILSSYLRLSFPSGLMSSRSPTKGPRRMETELGTKELPNLQTTLRTKQDGGCQLCGSKGSHIRIEPASVSLWAFTI